MNLLPCLAVVLVTCAFLNRMILTFGQCLIVCSVAYRLSKLFLIIIRLVCLVLMNVGDVLGCWVLLS